MTLIYVAEDDFSNSKSDEIFSVAEFHRKEF